MIGRNISWIPPSLGQGEAGNTKEGQDRRALAPGDPHPQTLLSFSICLLGGGSLSDLVRDLTVPKCVTLSIICGGWFCGEKGLLYYSWLPCTKSVRKANVKYQISNKTKQHYGVKRFLQLVLILM